MVIDFDAPAGDNEPAPVALARAWLAGGPLPGALPDEVAGALCDALARRGDGDRLGELARAGDKALAKRARRGLHLLRARGVAAEIPSVEKARPVAVEPEEEAPALTSASIRDGERLLWYLRPHDTGGVEVLQARVTETEGLTRFEVGVLPRRQWREVEQELAGDAVLLPVREPRPWVRWLIEEAHQRALDAGRVPPRRYAEVKHLIERPEAPAEHPARALTAGIAVERSSAEVLSLPEARTWIPDERLARKAFQEIEQLSQSPIVLDERQRKEQVRDILRRVAGEALAGPWRARLERRLLDTAHHLVSASTAAHRATRDYLADAALCVKAAAEVADAARGVDEIALVHRLFELLIPKDAEPAAESPTGNLIITP